ncbi:disulfide bond formation protein B [Candidatus Woesearchaeota archaeon]|nr:disulfide bond formation protein B [Candidatus Woesearchaeota archaeon]
MVLEIIPETLNILTLISNIAITLIVLLLIYNRTTNNPNNLAFKKISGLFKKNYLLFGLVVSMIATLGSLFYSEILKYPPCVLCWWQRIFMYPQFLIFGFALLKKDKKIFNYSILLSFVGAGIALYHYLIQIGALRASSCDVVGYSSSCAEKFFLSYGYITIPMMALTAFILLIFLGLNMELNKENK